MWHCLRSYIKNSCFGSHQGLQTPRNNKSTRPKRPRAFICFSVFGTPDETLALVVDILLLDFIARARFVCCLFGVTFSFVLWTFSFVHCIFKTCIRLSCSKSATDIFFHAVGKPREKHACYMHACRYLNVQRGSVLLERDIHVLLSCFSARLTCLKIAKYSCLRCCLVFLSSLWKSVLLTSRFRTRYTCVAVLFFSALFML